MIDEGDKRERERNKIKINLKLFRILQSNSRVLKELQLRIKMYSL